MIQLIWALSIVGTFGIGYFQRELWERVKSISLELEKFKALQVGVNKEVILEEKSTLVDPDDPVQRAKWEQDQIMRKLNPKVYGEPDEDV